ncbi:CDP-glucose 4,6-dehydratase [Methylobacterium sp. SI9]|uniref:CDP-glucose 4,6-dehydratase n=1 Tax=Methylobacterium guangdongense TaxID=3138811 RepID=UPI00313CF0FB
MASRTNFWNGRKVFLTGHTGFKGSWLSILLSDWGSQIYGYALEADTRSIYQSAGVEQLLTCSDIADVRDLARLTASLAQSGAEVVFHLAAQPLVRPSYKDPVETYATNVMGTVNLLEACRRVDSVRAVVVVTSDKCYENREWLWGYRESEAMGGRDPYSSSKGCTELVTASYRDSFLSGVGKRVATARAGNVIGGGDYSTDRLFPDLVSSLLRNESTKIRNPNATRPWQHVLEPLSGYVTLAEHLLKEDGDAYAESWNFGPDAGSDRNVRDVVEATYRHWGSGRWEHEKGPQVHEANYLKLDSSKSRALLNWKPRWDFENTIAKSVEWYRADGDHADTLAVTRRQIEQYLSATGL